MGRKIIIILLAVLIVDIIAAIVMLYRRKKKSPWRKISQGHSYRTIAKMNITTSILS